jgi:signal transduction histidine kinase
MSETSTPGPESYVLLIVDDQPANLAVAIDLLERRGFQVAIARSGEDALARAKLVEPDLILLDILMPQMDGLETCRRLKAAESTKGIPVIFMTALAEAADKVAGFEAGGVDYVTKPFDLDEVMARVNTHLAMHAMRKRIEAQNARLQHEIAVREQFEDALRLAHNELEKRVAERTIELDKANAILRKEIIERKRAEEEREALLVSEQQARSKAEDADRLKDEFLAMLSHELRTPLTSILGWAQLLGTGRLDAATAQRGIAVIERSALVELKIVDDLLDVSSTIRGKLSLNAQPIDLVPVLQFAIDSIKLAVEAKGICISLSAKSMICKVWGDRSRLQQVFWNLLNNAIKFTPPGGQIDVSLQEVGSMARIRIRDTGEGISAEFLPHIFKRFRQADSSTRRQRGGLGLGLSIVHHLVEMHGGTVRGESEGKGQGATFIVDLPLMPMLEEAAASPSAEAMEEGDGSFPPTTKCMSPSPSSLKC